MRWKVRSWMADVLRTHPDVVHLAAKQRAKFEGWFKFELAARMARAGVDEVRIEPGGVVPHARHDLSFLWAGERYFVELKTVNTNWRIKGLENRPRPVTKNFNALTKDLHKLAPYGSRGLMAFVIFPVPPGDARWQSYVANACAKVRFSFSAEDDCETLIFETPSSEKYGLVTCVLSVSSDPPRGSKPFIDPS